MSKITQKNTKKVIITGILVSVLAVGGILAYLTATDTKTNKFELADSAQFASKITVVEPSWSATDSNSNGVPDAAENITPLQVIAKDPAVQNTSGLDAWATLTVDVPTATVKAGTQTTATKQELFTLEGLNTTDWKEATADKTEVTKDGALFTRHVYLYKTKLAGGTDSSPQKTPALFTSVKLIDLQNGQIATAELKKQVVVTADAIQYQGFADIDTAYAALKNTKASA